MNHKPEGRQQIMSGRFAKLNKEWLLRGWTDVPWALVNWRNGDFRELGRDGFYVAQSCDGRTDFGSPAFLPRHIALLDRFIAMGIAEQCSAGETLEAGQEYRAAGNPVVRGLHWSITGLCNLNCRHCFMEAPTERFGDFSLGEIWRLIDQFERANVPEVALTGGEPFMRKDLPEIIKRLTEKKIGVAEIFTNGVLITGAILDTFKRFGQRPLFKISFDGCRTHDYMRGTQDIEAKVIEAIRRVKSGGFPVTAITSVDRVTRNNLAETYQLMKELQVDGWWLAPPVEIGNWRGSDTGLSLEEMVEVCTPLLQRWTADGGPFRLKLWRFGLFRGPENGANGQCGMAPLPVATPDSWNCNGTHSRPYLLPDGALLPCSGYTGTSLMESMPNLLKQDLTEVWTDSPLRRISDLKKRDVLARNKACAGCEFFPECGSGCRVFGLTRTGDLLARDPVACELFRGGYIQRFREIAEAAGQAGFSADCCESSGEQG